MEATSKQSSSCRDPRVDLGPVPTCITQQEAMGPIPTEFWAEEPQGMALGQSISTAPPPSYQDTINTKSRSLEIMRRSANSPLVLEPPKNLEKSTHATSNKESQQDIVAHALERQLLRAPDNSDFPYTMNLGWLGSFTFESAELKDSQKMYKGIQLRPDGGVSKGYFSTNFDFREGTRTYPDGTEESGNFIYGTFAHGPSLCRKKYANGTSFEGHFEGLLRNTPGKGSWTFNDGTQMDGRFDVRPPGLLANAMMVVWPTDEFPAKDHVVENMLGTGIVYRPNKQIEIGSFKAGKLTGWATVIDADGTEQEGFFVKGILKAGKGKAKV